MSADVANQPGRDPHSVVRSAGASPAWGGSIVPLDPLAPRLRHRYEQLDKAYRSSMETAKAHLLQSGMAARAKTVGDRAPDFLLRGLDDQVVTLSALLSQGPVVLSFFRGEWCSFCRIEMDALIEARTQIVARGAQLLMVSPQGPTEALLDKSAGLTGLTILHDPLNGVGLQYGLLFRMPDILRHALLTVGVDLSHLYGTDAWLLPIPATYVVAPDGLIALAHTNPDFTDRLEPDSILQTLDRIGRTLPSQ